MPRSAHSFRAFRVSVAFLAFAALQTQASGQTVISAMAGYIHYVEGEVFLDNRRVEPKPTEFLHVLDGQRFRTGEGRAEILLTPGAFLRLGSNSEIEMISAGLARARLRVTEGSAIVQLLSVFEKDAIAILAGDGEVSFPKPGLYRVDAENPNALLRVSRGKAVVLSGDQKRELKGKQTLALSGIDAAAVEKFDPKQKDPLDEWNQTRADALVQVARDRRGEEGGMDRLYREWLDMTLRGPGQTRTARMPESRNPQPRQPSPSSGPRGR